MRKISVLILMLTVGTCFAAYNPNNPNGQATMANSQPVVIASNQSALTVGLPSGASTSALQVTGNSALASILVAITNPLAVTGTFWQATQPVSLASVPLATDAATESNQVLGNAALDSIDSKIAVVNTSAVTVSGSALPTGAATAALQSDGNSNTTQIKANLQSIDGKLPSVGQKVMAASQPVTISSDQSAVPISAASLPLPAGASTSALQTTGNSSLSSIDTKLPSQYNSGVPTTSLVDLTTHTYSATVVFSPTTSPTDIFSIKGSASKRIVIRHMSVTGIQSSNAVVLFYLVKRSTANSGGTSTTITPVAVATSYPSATATVQAYTANPTLGTLIGTIQADYVFIPDSSANRGSDATGFRGFNESPISILDSANEQLSINMNGVTVAGNVLACHVVWSEF